MSRKLTKAQLEVLQFIARNPSPVYTPDLRAGLEPPLGGLKGTLAGLEKMGYIARYYGPAGRTGYNLARGVSVEDADGIIYGLPEEDA